MCHYKFSETLKKNKKRKCFLVLIYLKSTPHRKRHFESEILTTEGNRGPLLANLQSNYTLHHSVFHHSVFLNYQTCIYIKYYLACSSKTCS